MRIGMLGTGDVGRFLGAGLAGLGHQVMMGSRDPLQDKVQQWVEATGDNASAGTFAEAAAFGELAVLATSWAGTEEAITLANPKNLMGKTILDATNPLDFSGGVPPKLALGHTDSGGEQVQRWLPGAHVVKAFNIVGHASMTRPDFPGGPPDMFLCGNDASAKEQAAGLARDLGWPVTDLGGIEASRYLEPLAMVWILYGFQTGTWSHAFKLLRK